MPDGGSRPGRRRRALHRQPRQHLSPVSAAPDSLAVSVHRGPGLIMRVVTALGGKADVRAAAKAIADIAHDHEVVLGTQSTMTGYLTIERELANLVPSDRALASIFTMVAVDPGDPACAPKRIFEIRPIKWLLEHNTIVIAAGGGGIPTTFDRSGSRTVADGECVVDKDLASELLARELQADLFVMLTDAAAVYINFGRPSQAAIRRASPASLASLTFAAGSMGPKVEAACRFAMATGKKAAIGALADLWKIIAGDAGTTISVDEAGITFVGGQTAASQLGRR